MLKKKWINLMQLKYSIMQIDKVFYKENKNNTRIILSLNRNTIYKIMKILLKTD